MFRELSRKKKQISAEECISLLKTEKRGVLSVVGDGGYPYGTPMNHFYNEEDGNIYFHCGTKGHRLDSIRKDGKASFCVMDSGFCKENEWAFNIKSVIVFGKAEIINDIKAIEEITYKLSRKFTDDDEYIRNEIKNHAEKTLLIKLVPEHICGKLVTES